MVLRFRLFQMVVVGIMLSVAGVLFGLTEASSLALGVLGVSVASVLRSLLLRPDLGIVRVVNPPRCNVGDRCTVELHVKNNSRRPSPPVVVVDAVGLQSSVSLRFGPLPPGGTAIGSYSLGTGRRGLFTLGPVHAVTIDPFGLTSRRIHCGTSNTMVAVRPRTWVLPRVELSSGFGGEQYRSRGLDHRTGDDEFSSLNEYTPGDDVRHIHWPSTARLGRPIVRRNEPLADQHSTIVIDASASSGDPMAFERALSVASSLISSIDERTRVIVVGGTDGAAPVRELGITFTGGHDDRAEHLLDQLCVLEQERSFQGSPAAGTEALTLGIDYNAGERVILVTPESGHPGSDGSGNQLRAITEGLSEAMVISTASSPSPPPTKLDWPAHFDMMFWDGTEPLSSVWSKHLSGDPLVGSSRIGGK